MPTSRATLLVRTSCITVPNMTWPIKSETYTRTILVVILIKDTFANKCHKIQQILQFVFFFSRPSFCCASYSRLSQISQKQMFWISEGFDTECMPYLLPYKSVQLANCDCIKYYHSIFPTATP